MRSDMYTIEDVKAAAERGWSPFPGISDTLRKSMQVWSAALDDAGLLLVSLGYRDIMRVVSSGVHEEFWVDCPRDKVRTGEALPGRCAYRQRLLVISGDRATKMTIEREWFVSTTEPDRR